jgi:hypothetical protein
MKFLYPFFIFLLTAPIISSGQTHSLLKNIGSGDQDGIPSVNEATVWNDKAYFISESPDGFTEQIWKTIGTTSGTTQVLTTNYGQINYLTSIKNGLIFNSSKSGNDGIYKSNGTEGGTSRLIEFPAMSVYFLEKLNDSLVIFITDNIAGDSNIIWSTNGTVGGTHELGTFDIKTDYLRYSFYKNSMIFTEKSTNFDLFSPVITDGTKAGTKLVTQYINEIVSPDIADVQSAVGTGILFSLILRVWPLVEESLMEVPFPTFLWPVIIFMVLSWDISM